MAKNIRLLLQSIYKAPQQRIEAIHHGVPVKLVPTRKTLKKKFGHNNMQIISTFGLLGSGKGIEYAIEAISNVASLNIIFLICLGVLPTALKSPNCLSLSATLI